MCGFRLGDKGVTRCGLPYTVTGLDLSGAGNNAVEALIDYPDGSHVWREFSITGRWLVASETETDLMPPSTEQFSTASTDVSTNRLYIKVFGELAGDDYPFKRTV